MNSKILKGVALNFVIAVVSLYLYKTELNSKLHISSLLFAIIIGMLVANFTKIAQRDDVQAGIKFSSKKF